MPTDDAGPAALAALGPFFAVVTPASDAPPADGWRPVQDLVDGPALDERVAHVQDVLARLSGAEVETRVAASTLSLGLFARLLSPVLGATCLGIPLPRPTLATARWQPAAAGPWPLSLSGPPRPADLEGLLADVVEPLATGFECRYALSDQVVRGNVASAAFGAARMVATARPDLGAAAHDQATGLLSGPLAGTGTVEGEFVRTSCCLYYRVPGGGYCGDCVLAHR